MENIPKLARERLKATPPGIHPDIDLLAAFAEHSLKGRERSQLLEHLAICDDCREMVSLAQAPSQAVALSPQKVRWFSLPLLRWSIAAALVVIASSTIVLRQHRANHPAHSVGQISAPQVNEDQRSKSFDIAMATPSPKEEKEINKAVPGLPKETRLVSRSEKKTATKQPAEEGAFVFKVPSRVTNEATDQLASTETPPPASTAKIDHPPLPAPSIPSTSENVEVTAAAPAISAEVSKAKEPANEGRAAATGGSVAIRKGVPDGMRLTARSYTDRNQFPLPRWTLAADGGLQRSFDSGKTWEKVPVEQGAVFRAVSAVGPEVWVGGAAGLLYHSSDQGGHWTRVKPATGEITLTADIATIAFTDAQHGKVTTTDGQSWTTSDAGQTWGKN